MELGGQFLLYSKNNRADGNFGAARSLSLMKSRKPVPRILLSAVSIVSLLFLLVISGVFLFGSDYDWRIQIATSLPPIIFALPPSVLLIVSGVKRSRRMQWVNAAALLVAAGPVMGFHWRSSAPPARGRVVRVMTWNVEKWSHGPGAVAAGVRAEHPDIVCFQEAGDYFYVQGAQGKGLMAALPEYRFVRAGEIIVASRWPVTKIAEKSLPPGPASRPALCVSVDIDGQKFSVVSAHLLPSLLGQHLTSIPSYASKYASDRHSQGSELISAMNSVPGPKILCGDFNAQPQSSVCRHIERGFPDVFDRAGRGYGYTLTANIPAERVDHIMTSYDVIPQACWVPNIVASDHRPVVADITLRTPRSP